MKISQAKIDKKLFELNGNNTNNPWVETSGQSSLVSTDIKEDGQVIFNGGKGMIVKLFFNVQTGEFKMFPLKIFREDE